MPRTLLLLCLLLLSFTARAEEGVILDGRAQLPEGRVFALSGDKLVVVHTVPRTVYFVRAELFSGEERIAVEAFGILDADQAILLSPERTMMRSLWGSVTDALIQVRLVGTDQQPTPGPGEEHKLAQAQHVDFGELEFHVYAPGATGFRAHVRKTTLQPPTLEAADPAVLPSYPRLVDLPAPQHEDLGWVTAGLQPIEAAQE